MQARLSTQPRTSRRLTRRCWDRAKLAVESHFLAPGTDVQFIYDARGTAVVDGNNLSKITSQSIDRRAREGDGDDGTILPPDAIQVFPVVTAYP